jgi:hypothetical protein
MVVCAMTVEGKVYVVGSDGEGPRFEESQINLAWSDGGVSW